MPRFTRILHEFLNRAASIAALVLVACLGCTNRAPSLRMLDARAGYGDAPDDAEVALYQRARHAQDSILQRAAPRVARVYIFPHELPTRDYFWGGYVSLLVNEDRWVYQQPDEDDAAPGVREIKHDAHRKRASHAPAPSKGAE